MVVCLERGADLHVSQLMPLPLTVSCFSKIQIGLPFWYRLTRVVLDKGPLNVCVTCVILSVPFLLSSRPILSSPFSRLHCFLFLHLPFYSLSFLYFSRQFFLTLPPFLVSPSFPSSHFPLLSKIQIGFTFLVPAYPGCPGKEAVKWLWFPLLISPFSLFPFPSFPSSLFFLPPLIPPLLSCPSPFLF